MTTAAVEVESNAEDRSRAIGRSSRFLVIAFAIVLIFLAAGCNTLTDTENIQDRATDPAGPIGGKHTIGQTFVSHYPGLNAIQLLPAVRDGPSIPDAVVSLHLRSSAAVGQDIAVASVKFDDLRHNTPVIFAFPPVPDSRDQEFYIFLEASESIGQDRLSVWSTKLDTYPQGTRYVDGQPVEGDLNFRTFYDYGLSAIAEDIARGTVENIWLILPLLAVMFLPGYVLLLLFKADHKREHDVAEMFALAVGLSIAAVGICTLFVSLLGLTLGESSLRIGAILIILLALGLQGKKWAMREPASLSFWQRFSGESAKRPGRDVILFASCLASILLATTVVRFLQIRDLVVPMWVDSIQHAEIAQLIVNAGRLPSSYRPFAPIEPFTYHFGFHALVAFFHWLSGLDIPRSMLVIGQALNALMALTTYALASRLFRQRLAGLIGATVVGLISVMPAYYVSWGRYTQLTGMVLLPITILLTLDALTPNLFRDPLSSRPARSRSDSVRALLLAAIAIGGLIISHPRVTVFFLCFLLAFLILEILGARGGLRQRGRAFVARSIRISLVGGLGMLLVAPWMWANLSPLVARTWQGASQATVSVNPFPFGYFGDGADRALIAMAAGGFLLGLARRNKAAITIGVWTGLMLLVANLDRIGLPGSTMVGNGAVSIALFLSIALLDGYLIIILATGFRLGERSFHFKTIAAIALAAIGLYGANGLIGIVNPSTVIFFHQDRAAMDWIATHTPPSAKFLINSYMWQFGIYVGSDGGYWIPALTGREATTPSLLYALGKPEYITRVSALGSELAGVANSDEELHRLIESNGITHIYIGYRTGVLHQSMFLNKPGYRLDFARDGIWIFELRANEER